MMHVTRFCLSHSVLFQSKEDNSLGRREKLRLIHRLDTPRTVVRPFEEADKGPFVEFMTNPEATRYLMFTDEQKTADGARGLLQFVIDSYATDHPIHSYSIALHDGTWIGSCGVSQVSDGGVWECYYSLLPVYWGHGYATEATGALLKYCFGHSTITEVRAYMSPDNVRSPAVAARLGMADLGILPYPVYAIHGRVFTLTREVYEERRDGQEAEAET